MSFESIIRSRDELLIRYSQAQSRLDAIDTYVAKHSAASSMVIKVGGGILEDVSLMADCVRVIVQLVSLGYYPVIVHGGGPQISQAIESLAEESIFRDGLRVTSPVALNCVVDTLQIINTALVDQFVQAGVQAVGLNNIFVAEHYDQEKYGEVGRVTSVTLADIEAAVLQGRIPVVSCLAHSVTGAPLNANGDDAAAELVSALRPLEYVSFTPTGGVNGTDGGLLRRLTKASTQHLHETGQLTGGMYKKVNEALRLIESGVVIQILIVHPRHLLEELFGEDGYGTIVVGK